MRTEHEQRELLAMQKVEGSNPLRPFKKGPHLRRGGHEANPFVVIAGRPARLVEDAATLILHRSTRRSRIGQDARLTG
jgi:hypothetical protein